MTRARRPLTVCLLLTLTLLVAPAPAPRAAAADWLWDLHQRAEQLEAAGDVEAALPLWSQLAAGYARRENWTNAALYWKKLGRALEDRGRRAEAVTAYENEAYFWRRAGHADWGAEDLQRADTLRVTIRPFVQRPKDARATAATLAPFEPQSGAYLGVYSELDPAVGSEPARAAAAYGRPHAAFLVYVPWRARFGDRVFPATWAERARAAGAALQVHWMPHRGLDDVQDDDYLRSFAREAAAAGVPIFLRFGGEMNGDWVAWHGDPQQYVAKWRLVAGVLRATAPNVALVWAPNHVPDHNIDAYYPGDEWVDWVGVSLYQDYYASGRADQPAAHESATDKLHAIYQRYADRKPILIAEWGSAHHEYTRDTSVAGWGALQIQRLYQSLPLLYPRVKAVFYFSVDQRRTPNPFHPTSVWSNYLLTAAPAVRDAYRAATAGPYFHAQVAPVGTLAAPFGQAELADFATVAAGRETLSTYVKIHDPFISRVEYLLAGRLAAATTAFPYSTSLDFTPWAGQTVSLEIRAFNHDGALEGNRVIRLVVGGGPGGPDGPDGPDATPTAPAFADLQGHWAAPLVQRMAGYGIVNGYPDGSYRPDETISREAFVKLVMAALGLQLTPPAPESGAPATPATVTSGFADVSPDRWSHGVVTAAVGAGLLVPGEYDGLLLRPADPIPRREMAVILVRAMGLWKEAEFEPHTPGFADAAAIPAAQRGYAALAAAHGLITGLPGNRFGGDEPATRAQAAVVIARLLDARAR